MTAVLLTAGCSVILGGLVLLVGLVVANVRGSGYDVDAATAAHQERRESGMAASVLEMEPEEAVS